MTYNLLIPDMTCGHCEKRVRAAVEEAGGKVDSLDLESKRAVITIDMKPEELAELLDEVGYTAQVQ